MPIMNEPHRFLNIEDAYLLRDALAATCVALGVANDDKNGRAVVAGRVSELARSGLNNVDAIRDRITYEARAMAEAGA